MKHHGVMTDQALRAMRLRNEARVRASIEHMGSRWLLHQDNAPKNRARMLAELAGSMSRARCAAGGCGTEYQPHPPFTPMARGK